MSRWVHRIAILTVCTALLPIGLGALVSTRGVGMAFRDWPTSDGFGMYAYPLWKADSGRFLEHSHRLAGTLIGFISIALVVVTAALEKRIWVRWLSAAILLGVILQGLGGGLRVLRDDPRWAVAHGSFASFVFALMVVMAGVTSPRWENAAPSGQSASRNLVWMSVVTCLVLWIQYLLGGHLRHQGRALAEHLTFAAVATGMIVSLAVWALRSSESWLRRPAQLILTIIPLQLCLGAGAFVAKWGAGPFTEMLGLDGLTPMAGSPVQELVRTLHVLGGMGLVGSCVTIFIRAARLHDVGARHLLRASADAQSNFVAQAAGRPA